MLIANGWKTYNKQSVKNQDLWIKIDKLSFERKLEWNWIRYHRVERVEHKPPHDGTF